MGPSSVSLESFKEKLSTLCDVIESLPGMVSEEVIVTGLVGFIFWGIVSTGFVKGVSKTFAGVR
jgi:hypothetical protein